MLKKGLFTILVYLAGTLAVQAFQVVITEILPDPSPAIGLPAEEFIELTNISGKTIDISRWQLSNGRTRSKFPDSIYLPADNILIICAAKSADQFTPFGRTLGLTQFPALSNEIDTIILSNASGETISVVAYSDKLYTLDFPSSGRSLEMINLQYACSFQNNWAPSLSGSGGTPGKSNSHINAPEKDRHFTLLYAFCQTDTTVILVFDDKIDASTIIPPGAIQTDPALQLSSLSITGDLQNRLECTLSRPLVTGQITEIWTNGITSCLQANPGGNSRVKFGLPDTGNAAMVINEILFDPSPDGADYLELFNPSANLINLQNITLANRNKMGDISSISPISNEPRCIFPRDYLVFTTKPEWISRQFLVKDPAKIIGVESLPSWPNESGTVVLQNKDGTIIDELSYSAAWHFELLRYTENVALERKNPSAKTQDATNWFSAAMSAGYGTPGYANSQQAGIAEAGQKVWLEPAFFSPNGDGMADLCSLHYRFDQPGFMLSTRIYNRSGQLVRTLVNNGLCGITGFFPFDGKDDKKNQLPANVYIVVTDIFSINGQVRNYRLAVTIGY